MYSKLWTESHMAMAVSFVDALDKMQRERSYGTKD
jgi:hypothetical protein